MRVMLAGLFVACAAALGIACDESEPLSHEGDAVTAVALFFTQERDGGRLPEGVEVFVRGVDTNTLAELDPVETKARYCMEFVYEAGRSGTGIPIRRVYVASLTGEQWSIDVANPDGTCEGVT
jgi:hypothetical protein